MKPSTASLAHGLPSSDRTRLGTSSTVDSAAASPSPSLPSTSTRMRSTTPLMTNTMTNSVRTSDGLRMLPVEGRASGMVQSDAADGVATLTFLHTEDGVTALTPLSTGGGGGGNNACTDISLSSEQCFIPSERQSLFPHFRDADADIDAPSGVSASPSNATVVTAFSLTGGGPGGRILSVVSTDSGNLRDVVAAGSSASQSPTDDGTRRIASTLVQHDNRLLTTSQNTPPRHPLTTCEVYPTTTRTNSGSNLRSSSQRSTSDHNNRGGNPFNNMNHSISSSNNNNNNNSVTAQQNLQHPPLRQLCSVYQSPEYSSASVAPQVVSRTAGSPSPQYLPSTEAGQPQRSTSCETIGPSSFTRTKQVIIPAPQGLLTNATRRRKSAGCGPTSGSSTGSSSGVLDMVAIKQGNTSSSDRDNNNDNHHHKKMPHRRPTISNSGPAPSASSPHLNAHQSVEQVRQENNNNTPNSNNSHPPRHHTGRSSTTSGTGSGSINVPSLSTSRHTQNIATVANYHYTEKCSVRSEFETGEDNNSGASDDGERPHTKDCDSDHRIASSHTKEEEKGEAQLSSPLPPPPPRHAKGNHSSGIRGGGGASHTRHSSQPQPAPSSSSAARGTHLTHSSHGGVSCSSIPALSASAGSLLHRPKNIPPWTASSATMIPGGGGGCSNSTKFNMMAESNVQDCSQSNLMHSTYGISNVNLQHHPPSHAKFGASAGLSGSVSSGSERIAGAGESISTTTPMAPHNHNNHNKDNKDNRHPLNNAGGGASPKIQKQMSTSASFGWGNSGMIVISRPSVGSGEKGNQQKKNKSATSSPTSRHPSAPHMLTLLDDLPHFPQDHAILSSPQDSASNLASTPGKTVMKTVSTGSSQPKGGVTNLQRHPPALPQRAGFHNSNTEPTSPENGELRRIIVASFSDRPAYSSSNHSLSTLTTYSGVGGEDVEVVGGVALHIGGGGGAGGSSRTTAGGGGVARSSMHSNNSSRVGTPRSVGGGGLSRLDPPTAGDGEQPCPVLSSSSSSPRHSSSATIAAAAAATAASRGKQNQTKGGSSSRSSYHVGGASEDERTEDTTLIQRDSGSVRRRRRIPEPASLSQMDTVTPSSSNPAGDSTSGDGAGHGQGSSTTTTTSSSMTIHRRKSPATTTTSSRSGSVSVTPVVPNPKGFMLAVECTDVVVVDQDQDAPPPAGRGGKKQRRHHHHSHAPGRERSTGDDGGASLSSFCAEGGPRVNGDPIPTEPPRVETGVPSHRKSTNQKNSAISPSSTAGEDASLVKLEVGQDAGSAYVPLQEFTPQGLWSASGGGDGRERIPRKSPANSPSGSIAERISCSPVVNREEDALRQAKYKNQRLDFPPHLHPATTTGIVHSSGEHGWFGSHSSSNHHDNDNSPIPGSSTAGVSDQGTWTTTTMGASPNENSANLPIIPSQASSAGGPVPFPDFNTLKATGTPSENGATATNSGTALFQLAQQQQQRAPTIRRASHAATATTTASSSSVLSRRTSIDSASSYPAPVALPLPLPPPPPPPGAAPTRGLTNATPSVCSSSSSSGSGGGGGNGNGAQRPRKMSLTPTGIPYRSFSAASDHSEEETSRIQVELEDDTHDDEDEEDEMDLGAPPGGGAWARVSTASASHGSAGENTPDIFNSTLRGSTSGVPLRLDASSSSSSLPNDTPPPLGPKGSHTAGNTNMAAKGQKGANAASLLDSGGEYKMATTPEQRDHRNIDNAHPSDCSCVGAVGGAPSLGQMSSKETFQQTQKGTVLYYNSNDSNDDDNNNNNNNNTIDGFFSYQEYGDRDEEEEEYDDDDEDDYQNEQAHLDNATGGTGTMTIHRLPHGNEQTTSPIDVVGGMACEEEDEGIRSLMAQGCVKLYGSLHRSNQGDEGENATTRTAVSATTGSVLPGDSATMVVPVIPTKLSNHFCSWASACTPALVNVFYLEERWFSTEVLLYGMCLATRLGTYSFMAEWVKRNAITISDDGSSVKSAMCGSSGIDWNPDMVWLAFMSMASKLHGDISYSPHSLVTRLQGLYASAEGEDDDGSETNGTIGNRAKNTTSSKTSLPPPTVTDFCQTEWAVFQSLQYNLMISRDEYDMMERRALSCSVASSPPRSSDRSSSHASFSPTSENASISGFSSNTLSGGSPPKTNAPNHHHPHHRN